MSKQPRTLEFFFDLIDKEYSWRITELSSFRSSILSEKNPKVLNGKLRAGVALLYAHWEGFIKRSANLYFEFVGFQSLKLEDLNNSFVSVLLRGELNTLQGSNKLRDHVEVINTIIEKKSLKANFPNKSPIRTANLNFDVFQDVCILLGIDPNEFEVRYKRTFDRNIELTINEDLVVRRNKIAHGEFLPITSDEFKKLYDVMIHGFLLTFKDIVMDCAQRKSYLR